MDTEELFQLLNRDDETDKDEIPARLSELEAETRAAQLLEYRESLFIKHLFKTGDLIQWKAGMSNRKMPAYGEPLLVTEVFGEAFRLNFERYVGTPYFLEQHDIRAGVLDEDGDFMEFSYDSRRFEPYTGKILR